jgi:hypothetical protein
MRWHCSQNSPNQAFKRLWKVICTRVLDFLSLRHMNKFIVVVTYDPRMIKNNKT